MPRARRINTGQPVLRRFTPSGSHIQEAATIIHANRKIKRVWPSKTQPVESRYSQRVDRFETREKARSMMRWKVSKARSEIKSRLRSEMRINPRFRESAQRFRFVKVSPDGSVQFLQRMPLLNREMVFNTKYIE